MHVCQFFVLDMIFSCYFQIKREQVDRFKPRSQGQEGPMRSGRTPSCQLQAKWSFRDEPPVDLSRKVKLAGAKKPNDFFLLTIDSGALHKQGMLILFSRIMFV